MVLSVGDGMEFNRSFKEFPRWGKTIAWTVAFGVTATMTWYATTHGPAILSQLAEAAIDLLG